jgi:hypothetical protein
MCGDLMFLLNESKKENGKKQGMYIVLTYTDTLFAKVEKKILNVPYTHCSVSLDESLTDVWAFNTSGFLKENVFENEVMKNSKYSIYFLELDDIQYHKMKMLLNHFITNKESFSYNFKGIFNIISFKKPTETNEKFFCSEFVAHLINEINPNYLNKHKSLMTPYNFAKNKNFKFLCRGNKLGNYNPSKLRY